MRSAKLFLLVGLAALSVGVPVSAALGSDDSSSGLCVSLGSDLSLSLKCSDKSKAGKNENAGSTQPQGGNGEAGGKGGSGEDHGGKQPGQRSGSRVPRDTDARPVKLPPRARPIFGHAVAVAAVSGQIRVKLPGAPTFVALADVSRLPNGSLIDTSAGVVQLSSLRKAGGRIQTAAFSGTTFSVRQPRSASGVTELKLVGGRISGCPRSGTRAFASAARSSGRRLWGNGHGRFRTRGRYGAASVRGTVWLTEDRCDGTLVRVHRGRVSVRDLVRHRSTLVRAGHSRLVRAAR